MAATDKIETDQLSKKKKKKSMHLKRTKNNESTLGTGTSSYF